MWVCGGKVLPPRTQTWITIITAVKSKDLSDSEGQQVKTLSVTFCPKLQGHAIAIYTRNIRDIVKLTEGCQQNVNLETWPQPFCQRHSSRCVIDLCCSRKPASVIYYTSFHKNIGEPWHHIKTLLIWKDTGLDWPIKVWHQKVDWKCWSHPSRPRHSLGTKQ